MNWSDQKVIGKGRSVIKYGQQSTLGTLTIMCSKLSVTVVTFPTNSCIRRLFAVNNHQVVSDSVACAKQEKSDSRWPSLTRQSRAFSVQTAHARCRCHCGRREQLIVQV